MEISPLEPSSQRRLVIGGARSGKSWFAESLVTDAAQLDYVATSERRADDPEWEARLAAHIARRPAHWRTVETLDIAGVLAEPGPPVLVDCLTLWLTRAMDLDGCWPDTPDAAWSPAAGDGRADGLARVAERIDALVAALTATTREVIMVTNEVGQGVVPATASGRLFRDQMGVLNLRIARVCDEVWWVVAGLPTRLQGRG